MTFVRWRNCSNCGELIDWSLRKEYLIEQVNLKEHRGRRKSPLPDAWIGDYMVTVTCQNCGQAMGGIKKLEGMPI